MTSDPQAADRATITREELIAQTIEGWMRSDGFAHRHARVIWTAGVDLVPLKAADCAHFVEQALERQEREDYP